MNRFFDGLWCVYIYTYIYYDIHIQIMRKVRVQNQLLTGGHLVPYVQWSSYMVNMVWSYIQ